MPKKNDTLPTANDLAQALDAWRAGMGRLRPFLQLDEVVTTIVTAAQYRDQYEKQAEAARAELEAVHQQIADAKAAHEHARHQARVDLQAEHKELTDAVAALQAEKDVLQGDLADLMARRDEVLRVVEQMKAKFAS